jgi:hypothetical protein
MPRKSLTNIFRSLFRRDSSSTPTPKVRLSTSSQDAYQAPYPHCDNLVLHAPGECECCDHYPKMQRQRVLNKVAFSGHDARDGEMPCPSESRRSRDIINRWRGNIARPKSTFVPPKNGNYRWNAVANVWEFYVDTWGWSILRVNPANTSAPMSFAQGIRYILTGPVAYGRQHELGWLNEKADALNIDIFNG